MTGGRSGFSLFKRAAAALPSWPRGSDRASASGGSSVDPWPGTQDPTCQPNKTVWVSPIASRDSLGCPAVCPPQTGSRPPLGSDKLLSQAEIPETLQSCTLLSSLAVETGSSTGQGCVWDHRDRSVHASSSQSPEPSPPSSPARTQDPGPGPRMRHPLQLHLFTSWA